MSSEATYRKCKKYCKIHSAIKQKNVTELTEWLWKHRVLRRALRLQQTVACFAVPLAYFMLLANPSGDQLLVSLFLTEKCSRVKSQHLSWPGKTNQLTTCTESAPVWACVGRALRRRERERLNNETPSHYGPMHQWATGIDAQLLCLWLEREDRECIRTAAVQYQSDTPTKILLQTVKGWAVLQQ